MKRILCLLMIVFLLSGCAGNEKRELSQHTFKGLSFKVSDEWTFDEEWEEDDLNETGTSRFFSGEVKENVVSFDLKELSGVKGDEEEKKAFVVDKFTFDNHEGLGSASGGKWEKVGETEYYIENVEYSAYGNSRKGKNIIVPSKDYKSCYVILALCTKRGLANSLVDDLGASFELK